MPEKTIKNEILGELIWDSKLNWWSSKVEFTSGDIVNVSVDAEDTETSTSIELACHSFTRIQKQEINFRRCAANQLLDLYNDSWNNGYEIDCQTFMQLIKLAEVHINSDGSANLYYDDGDLFGGHVIIISIDCDGAFEDAEIAG